MEIGELVRIIGGPNQNEEEIKQQRRDSVFIDKHYGNLMEMHSGQWIAVNNEKLVALEDGFEELLVQLDASGIKRKSTALRFLDPNPPTYFL